MAVVASVCRATDLSSAVAAAFVHQVAIETPTEEQRRRLLLDLSRDLQLSRDVDLDRLAKLTAVRHDTQHTKAELFWKKI